MADKSVQAKLRSQMSQTALAVIRAVDGALADGDVSWEMLRDASGALAALSSVLERGDAKSAAAKTTGSAKPAVKSEKNEKIGVIEIARVMEQEDAE